MILVQKEEKEKGETASYGAASAFHESILLQVTLASACKLTVNTSVTKKSVLSSLAVTETQAMTSPSEKLTWFDYHGRYGIRSEFWNLKLFKERIGRAVEKVNKEGTLLEG
ncbi:hypothetical protein TNCV_801981 [Trichonephila clavipes]|nr:hypothetical protein TNCV_801981 [Trichonephila clavipes]